MQLQFRTEIAAEVATPRGQTEMVLDYYLSCVYTCFDMSISCSKTGSRISVETPFIYKDV